MTRHRPSTGGPGSAVLRWIGRAALKLWPFVLVIVLWQAWITLG